MNMEFKNLLSCTPKQQITECYKYRKPDYNSKERNTEIYMNKVELEAINKIVNSSLENLEEEEGIQKLRNQQKGKPSDAVKDKLNNAMGAAKSKNNEDGANSSTAPSMVTNMKVSQQANSRELSKVTTNQMRETLATCMSFLELANEAVNRKTPSTQAFDQIENLLKENIPIERIKGLLTQHFENIKNTRGLK